MTSSSKLTWFNIITITATNYVISVAGEIDKIKETLRSGECNNINCHQAFMINSHLDKETNERVSEILDLRKFIMSGPNNEINISFGGDSIKLWGEVDVETREFNDFIRGANGRQMAESGEGNVQL